MATVSCGRGALAIALFGAFASSVEAAEWTGGIIVDRGEAVQMDPGDILRVSGENTVGVRVKPRATFDAEGVSILHAGAGRGVGYAYGILADDGAEVSLAGSRVEVHGQRAYGVHVHRNAVVDLRDTVVQLPGAADDTSTALALAGGTTVLRGSTIEAGRGYAVGTHFSGDETARVPLQDARLQLHDTTIRGRIGSGDTPLDVAAVGAGIDGDIVRESAGALTVRLQRSAWRGKATHLTALSLQDSTWTVTADSDVSALRLDRGGQLVFDHAGKGFRTLRVGAWQAGTDAGGIVLGTRLDAGGGLRRQATDRLLVSGDASGSSPVHVVNVGGRGAPTAGRNGFNGPSDGISLIQVGGSATAESFRLAENYVAVGPWQYRLHAYEPGQSDPRQRLLDGEGAGYWDFRLQSANVDDPEQGRGRSAIATRAALLPQVPAYLVLTHALLGYGSAALDALRPVDLEASRDPALRVRAFGGSIDYRSTLPFQAFGFDYTRHDRGLQLAGDLLVHATGDTTLRAGLAASLGGTRVSPRAVEGSSEARVDARGLALHATLVTESDWRVASTYAITHYRVDVRTPSRGEVLGRLRANANEAALAADYRWHPTGRLLIEPGTSVTWQRLRYSRAVDGDDIELLAGTPERVTFRGGARASLTFVPKGKLLYAWTPYLDVRYVATRGSGESVSLSGERFATGRAGRSAELSAGASFHLWSRVTAHIGAACRLRVGQGGESALTARAGLAMTF